LSKTLILTGDVQGSGEEAMTSELQKIMAGKPLTILKIAHHGSKYSTPADFLKVASPRLALISAGRNNRYGHPHKEVISRLGDAGCVILSTKESGAVILYISRAKIAVRISSCRN
jgi:competence protein ComEC